jgi:RNA polymerase sigma-70 factor (ECF subfamily)
MESREFELVCKATAGDKDAFFALYKTKSESILLHAMSILGNYHDAEDAAQEVVIKLYNHIGGLNDPAAFNAWMQRIVTNVCYSIGRKKKKHNDDADITDYENAVVDEDREFLPASYAEDKEIAAKLRQVIEMLPEKQHRAILMYYYDEMSYRDIAYALNSTTSTVSTNIVKAKKRIKTEMENYMEGTSGTTGKSGTAGIAGMTVLSRVLHEIPETEFPRSRIAEFERSCDHGLTSHIAHANTSASSGAKAIGAKMVVAVLAATVLVTVGILTLTNPAGSPADLPASSDADRAATGTLIIGEGTDALKKGQIEFTGECACGHLNPASVNLAGIDTADTTQTWQIIRETGDADAGERGTEVIASGEGTDAAAALAGLYADKADGDYLMVFNVKDREGNTARIERRFHIDTGEIIPGRYL